MATGQLAAEFTERMEVPEEATEEAAVGPEGVVAAAVVALEDIVGLEALAAVQ